MKVGDEVYIRIAMTHHHCTSCNIRANQVARILQIIDDIALVIPYNSGHEIMVRLSNLKRFK